MHPQGHIVLPQSRVEVLDEDSPIENRCSVGDVLMWSGCELSQPGQAWIGGVRTPEGVARTFHTSGRENSDHSEDERILIVPHVENGEITMC